MEQRAILLTASSSRKLLAWLARAINRLPRSFVDGEAVFSEPKARSGAVIEAPGHWQTVVELIAADCSAGHGSEVAINRAGVIAESGEGVPEHGQVSAEYRSH